MRGGFIGALVLMFVSVLGAVWVINHFKIGGGVTALGA
jgi:hypothetical protein